MFMRNFRESIDRSKENNCKNGETVSENIIKRTLVDSVSRLYCIMSGTFPRRNSEMTSRRRHIHSTATSAAVWRVVCRRPPRATVRSPDCRRAYGRRRSRPPRSSHAAPPYRFRPSALGVMVAMAMYFYASRLTATAAKTLPPSTSSNSNSAAGKRSQTPVSTTTSAAAAAADQQPVSSEKVSPSEMLIISYDMSLFFF